MCYSLGMANLLRGAHAISLDVKGRLAIPTKYRDWLRDECDGQLVCTIDIAHPCLLLYPLHEWEEIERKLKTLSSMDPAQRRLQRLLLGHATECELDGNGRLLLSQPLRTHAGLDKKIMLVGQLNKFELWDESRWQHQIDTDIASLPEDDWAGSDRLQDFSL
jgi:MraZ protein